MFIFQFRPIMRLPKEHELPKAKLSLTVEGVMDRIDCTRAVAELIVSNAPGRMQEIGDALRAIRKYAGSGSVFQRVLEDRIAAQWFFDNTKEAVEIAKYTGKYFTSSIKPFKDKGMADLFKENPEAFVRFAKATKEGFYDVDVFKYSNLANMLREHPEETIALVEAVGVNGFRALSAFRYDAPTRLFNESDENRQAFVELAKRAKKSGKASAYEAFLSLRKPENRERFMSYVEKTKEKNAKTGTAAETEQEISKAPLSERESEARRAQRINSAETDLISTVREARKTRNKDLIPDMIGVIEDPKYVAKYPKLCREAVLTLGVLKASEARPALEKIASNTKINDNFRVAALDALLNISDKKSADTFEKIALNAGNNLYIRKLAIEALEEIGATAKLVNVLGGIAKSTIGGRTEPYDLRFLAIKTLGKIGSLEAEGYLKELANNPRMDIKNAADIALAVIEDNREKKKRAGL